MSIRSIHRNEKASVGNERDDLSFGASGKDEKKAAFARDKVRAAMVASAPLKDRLPHVVAIHVQMSTLSDECDKVALETQKSMRAVLPAYGPQNAEIEAAARGINALSEEMNGQKDQIADRLGQANDIMLYLIKNSNRDAEYGKKIEKLGEQMEEIAMSFRLNACWLLMRSASCALKVRTVQLRNLIDKGSS